MSDVRLIDANELQQEYIKENGKRLLLIDVAPTVEYPFYAEAYQTGYEEGKNERPQGEWVKIVNKISETETETRWECSECHNPDYRLGEAEFCSFCGAKMCADMRGEK